MTKVLLFSILLVVVYSWEEMKQAVISLFYRALLRRVPPGSRALHLDRVVGNLVMLCALPISMTWFLTSNADLYHKLAYLVLLFGTTTLAAATGFLIVRRLTTARVYEGTEEAVATTLALLGLFRPVFRQAFVVSGVGRKTYAKFALLLVIPPAAGIIIGKLAYSSTADVAYLPHINELTAVLVGALTIRIAIEFLERHFKLYRLETLFSYFRVALGVALAVIAISGVI